MLSFVSVREDMLLLRLSYYAPLRRLSSTGPTLFNNRMCPTLGANNAHRRKPRRKCREVLKHHLGCRYSQTIKVLPYPAEIFIYGLILLQFIVLETDFSHTQLYSGSLGGIVAYRSGPKTTYIRKTTLLSFSTYGYLWIKTTLSFTYD